MIRREMLGSLGVGVGLAALGAAGKAVAADDAEKHDHAHDKTHEECLKACTDCATACNTTFHHCYMEVAAGKAEHAKALHLVSDCAGFCTLSAAMIAKHSPLMAHSCESCADACKDTLAEVSKFDSDHMKMAAKHLKACEDSCRKMVADMKAHGEHAHAH